MTTKQLQRIRDLNRQGLNDRQIAEDLGCSLSTAHYWRTKLELPPTCDRSSGLTTMQLERFRELGNRTELSDREISEQFGTSVGVVRYWRKKLGLPVKVRGKKPGSGRSRYTVYNRMTGEYLCEGTAQEISKYIGIAVSTIYAEVTVARKGQHRTRYEILEVEDDE